MKKKLDIYALEPPGFDLANYQSFADMNVGDWGREIFYRYILRRVSNKETRTDCTARLMENPLTPERGMFTNQLQSSDSNAKIKKRTTKTIHSVTVGQVFQMADELDGNIETEGSFLKRPRASRWPEEMRDVTYDSVMATRSPYHRQATLTVNLDWSEKEIRKDFMQRLREIRNENKISNRGGRIDMARWHQLRIIPCFDLMEWARARDQEWSTDALASILNTDKEQITAKAVGRTIKPRIETVISTRMIAKLSAKHKESIRRNA